MNDRRFNPTIGVKQALAAGVAVIVLMGGAAWHSLAADSQKAAQSSAATTTAPAIPRTIAGERDSYADLVKRVAPSVVTIRVEGKAKVSPTDFQGDDLLRRFFGDQFDRGERGQRQPRSFKQRGLGSGVIVGSDGYILTNNHVVDDADDIQVELADGTTTKAKLIGTDKPSDLAVIKVEAPNLHAIALGDSDGVQVGDVVLAVGNPFGMGQTVTMGIISAKGRFTSVGGGSYEDFLQTDAPINHGNSGGALVNTKGELVGINSQIAPVSDVNIGIGFAIPVNMARNVADQLRKEGRVHRSQLGVAIQPVTAEMAESLGLKEAGGAIISSVEKGSAADNAGLKQGDVIRSFNGQPVQDINGLRNRVAAVSPGSNATVTIVRDGSQRDVTVKLDEAVTSKTARRSDEPAAEDKAALGVSVAPLTPETASRLGIPRDSRGLVVEDVNPDGRAADAGIQAGDVIQEVNRQPVATVDELRAAVRGSNKPLLMLIAREGRNVFVTVRPTA
jgi:Do/DeqQ family serine protease